MLLALTTLAIGYAIGYLRGKKDGAFDMERLFHNAAQIEREFFSSVSAKNYKK